MKKKIFTFIFLAILLTAIIFVCVFLSTLHRKHAQKNKITDIVGENIVDNSVYMGISGLLLKFDLESGNIEKLCRDENCSDKCLLCSTSSVIRIYMNKIFFTYRGTPAGFAYYDMNTGKTHIIKEYEFLNTSAFMYNGYIYHMLDTGNTKKPRIFRLSPDGKEKAILNLEKNEWLIMVADGMIITANSSAYGQNEPLIIYSYDINTLKRRELLNIMNEDLKSISNCEFYNGKLYFSCNNVGLIPDQAPEGYLYCLDIFSGELTKVCELPVISFAVTKDGLYYNTSERREVKNEDGTSSFFIDYTVWKSDLSGTSSQEFYKINDTQSNHDYSILTVRDGKIFGDLRKRIMFTAHNYLFVADMKNNDIKIMDIPK